MLIYRTKSIIHNYPWKNANQKDQDKELCEETIIKTEVKIVQNVVGESRVLEWLQRKDHVHMDEDTS